MTGDQKATTAFWLSGVLAAAAWAGLLYAAGCAAVDAYEAWMRGETVGDADD